jgi:CHAT domain-containing protein
MGTPAQRLSRQRFSALTRLRHSSVTLWAKEARASQSCPLDVEAVRQRVAAAVKSVPVLGAVVRGGVNLAALRAQTPLPETADELCRVAKALGALGREPETVWLGAQASEANVKALSRAGKLSRYQVLHFATHGLLAGESEAILRAKAEPALLLSPPKDGATPERLEEDDGLPTASEVAQLDLDADWVVLSACTRATSRRCRASPARSATRRPILPKRHARIVSDHGRAGRRHLSHHLLGVFDLLRSARHRARRPGDLRAPPMLTR